MRLGLISIVMLASVAAMPSAAAPKAAHKVVPKPPVKVVPKLIQSCDAHKFETVVDSIVEGQPHQSKVRLCGVEGQSDAEWIDTLRDAIKKLDANKDMPASQREQIATAIKAEIARLTILGAGPALPQRGRAARVVPPEPLSRDYATLPPIPVPREPAPTPVQKDLEAQNPAGHETTPPVQRNFAQLPPMPPPLATAAPPPAAAAVLAPALAPRLNFGCDTPGDLSSDAPCAEFERETRVTVHAGEDIPAGTLLQFVRNDRPQADVPLGGLRRGSVLRVVLPAKVCSGFASGKLELRVVRDDGNGAPRPLSSEGPYSLRC
jgi:hypothetical protein